MKANNSMNVSGVKESSKGSQTFKDSANNINSVKTFMDNINGVNSVKTFKNGPNSVNGSNNIIQKSCDKPFGTVINMLDSQKYSLESSSSKHDMTSSIGCQSNFGSKK